MQALLGPRARSIGSSENAHGGAGVSSDIAHHVHIDNNSSELMSISLSSLFGRIRGNKYLKKLAKFAGPHRRCSSARFTTDLAAVSSILTTVACDILFLSFSKQPLEEVQRRHGPALQAVGLLYEIVDNPAVLGQFGFSQAQIDTTVSFFSDFAGAAGLQPVEPDSWALRRAVDRRPRIPEEAPFMVQLLFLLLSRQFPLPSLAECLARARFGFWSADRGTFFPELPVQAEGSMRWGVRTVNAKDLGPVTVSFSGPFIDAIRFVSPWPAARFREGRHFMDERFRLPLAEGSTTVFQTTAASDGLYWAEPAWYRYFGDDVAGGVGCNH